MRAFWFISTMTFPLDSQRLMANRIHETLLVASPYELYLMEEEGLLADRISTAGIAARAGMPSRALIGVADFVSIAE